jgi:hypothetical protein
LGGQGKFVIFFTRKGDIAINEPLAVADFAANNFRLWPAVVGVE